MPFLFKQLYYLNQTIPMTRIFNRFPKSSRSRFPRRGYSDHQARFQGKLFSHPKPFRLHARRPIKTIDPALLTKKATTSMPQAAYQSKHTFASFAISEVLKQNIKTRGYAQPTPIQDQAIPVILEGRDVVGIANTGTGKTAAFLIPLLHKISHDVSQKVLIVAPTRELAVQIYQECQAFAQGMNIYSAICIGGVNIRPQIEQLRNNPHVVIGTPGRLKDLKNQGKLNFAIFANIVLDEVDRMLDMGFIKDVRFIISHLPKYRQSLFFSATLSPTVREVMQTFLTNPITISVKAQERPLNIDQDIIKTNGRVKLDVLHELLNQAAFKKVLVFGRTKWGIEKLAKQLNLKGLVVAALHGNKNQNQRQRALTEFKHNRVNVLLATDIASRGLDIPDVTHVINYDLPENYDDYIHRIGRTGRAGKKGIALSFVE
jgi:superfamily II DNA/RNA helicase